ncbi:MAG: AfsR/SARP family transcriptional regulator, partial [Acidobacteriota bacterium]
MSGAAFEAIPLLLPAVIEPDIKPPAPVSRKEERVKTKNPSLVVYGLGHFRVYCDDQLITTWRSKKGKSIFKYLLAQRDHQATKDILMDVFWPDASPEAARNNLNVAIHGLRQVLKTVRPDWPFILYEDEHYVLNPTIELWVDFEEYSERYEVAAKFEREGELAKALHEYERAESLYSGDLLEEDLYEDWPILQ